MTRSAYTPNRERFPRSTKARRAFAEERNWTCECGCGAPIVWGRDAFQIDHIIAKALRYSDHWDDLRLLLDGCHKIKTKSDMKLIAKAKRLEAKHNGTFAPRSKLPGSRDSGWKRKVSGEWVRR